MICVAYRHRRRSVRWLFGTSENAAKSQVWIAVATYLLVTIARKRLKLESLHRMLQVLSVTPYETCRTPGNDLIARSATLRVPAAPRVLRIATSVIRRR
jgi:hypothetical protein